MTTDTTYTQDITDKIGIYSNRIEAHLYLSEKLVIAMGKHNALYGGFYHKKSIAVMMDFTHKMTKNYVEYEHYLKQAYVSLSNKKPVTKYLQ